MVDDKSDAEILREFRDGIEDRGNSHNPEFWTVASDIDEYITALEGGADREEILSYAREQRKDPEDKRVGTEAPETVIAVLTGVVDCGECNGCGRTRSVDPDGFCWYCRGAYDSKQNHE